MTEPRNPVRAHVDYDIRSPFRSYFRGARDLVVEPEAFFRAVRDGSLWGPTQFVFATYLLVLLPVAPFFLLFLATMFSRLANLDSSAATSLSIREIVGLAAPFLAIVLTPFFGVLGTFVGALIWHPFVALSVGPGCGAGFRETYRITAYQSLPYVVGGLIPLLGFFVALGGMSYVGVFGVKGAHGTTTTCAIVSVAIPLVLTFLLFIALVIVAIAIATSASR